MPDPSQAAANAIQANEVSNNPALADRITRPANGGGWTIGFNQQDFKTNPAVAQNTLITSLVDSGQFTTTNATTIAQALTTAGTGSNPNFQGATDTSGHLATVDSINAALRSNPAQTDIRNFSNTDLTNQWNSLVTNVFGSSQLTTPVGLALEDRAQGPLLRPCLRTTITSFT